MTQKRYVSLFWAVLAAGIPMALNAVWDVGVEINELGRTMDVVLQRLGDVEGEVLACVSDRKINEARNALLEQRIEACLEQSRQNQSGVLQCLTQHPRRNLEIPFGGAE